MTAAWVTFGSAMSSATSETIERWPLIRILPSTMKRLPWPLSVRRARWASWCSTMIWRLRSPRKTVQRPCHGHQKNHVARARPAASRGRGICRRGWRALRGPCRSAASAGTRPRPDRSSRESTVSAPALSSPAPLARLAIEAGRWSPRTVPGSPGAGSEVVPNHISHGLRVCRRHGVVGGGGGRVHGGFGVAVGVVWAERDPIRPQHRGGDRRRQ